MNYSKNKNTRSGEKKMKISDFSNVLHAVQLLRYFYHIVPLEISLYNDSTDFYVVFNTINTFFSQH